MFEDIRSFLKPETEEPFWLDMAGISYCDGSYLVQRHNAGVYVFEYILEGTGTVQAGGREFTASAGDAYILHRGDDHRYYSDDKDPWTKVFFNVNGELVERLLTIYGLESRMLIRHSGVKELFMEFYEITRGAEPVEELNRRCALKFHEILLRLYEKTRDVPEVSREALLLRQYLDARVEQKVTVEEMAASIYRSKDYAIKLFKREFGQTPYSYLIRKKMDMAKSLLRNTTIPVKQIAFRLGYDDQNYFSNLFKKETGASPVQFRKSREGHD